MKLSMWMFHVALSKKVETDEHIRSGNCCITGIRGFLEDISMAEEFAYIGRPEQFSIASQWPCVIFHKGDYIAVNAQPIAVINMTMDFISYANNTELRLRQAALSEHPFQAIADIVNEVSNRPITINDNYFRVLGIAGDMAGDSWTYMKRQGASPPEFVGRFVYEDKFNHYMTSRAPMVNILPAYALWKASLSLNCFFEDSVMCRMCISLPDADAPKGLVQFAEQVRKIIEAIPINTVHKFLTEDIANATSLLEGTGELDPNDAIYRRIESLYKNKRFYVCRLSPTNSAVPKTIYYWVCGRLEAMLPGNYAFPYQDYIVLLVPTAKKANEVFAFTLPSLLTQVGFICTVSNPCSDLSHIRDCYRQTADPYALHPAEQSCIFFYEDCADKALINAISAQQDWSAWIHTGIQILSDYDDLHHTNYLETLLCLVDHQFALANTADALFIHRNSLQYRLNKMSDLMACDISDPKNRFYLTLSCRLYQAQVRRKTNSQYQSTNTSKSI